jgi:predicted hydrocarbon binding protein
LTKEANPFFVMPGSALRDLREELELIEDDMAAETLARYGYRAGVGLIKSLGVEAGSFEEFMEVLPQIWSETGLSRMTVKKATETELLVTFDESIEAVHGRKCDFTRGYLAGIVSSLSKRRWNDTEISCMSQGVESCVHLLKPAEEPKAEAPEQVETLPKVELEAGYSYLIESEDPNAGFEIFEDYLAHGSPGLCVVREFPDKVRKRFDLKNAPCLWLSYERDIPFAREPTNIPLIYAEIKSFFDGNDRAILLISGLEYLASQSTFIKILKFIQLLNENVAVRDGLMLIPISPEALSSRDVKLLERELRVLKTDAPRREPSQGNA